jgi:hypothetical protein
MNDNPSTPIPAALATNLCHPSILGALAETMELAKAGKVAGITIVVAHGGDAISIKMGGNGATALASGCQQACRQLLDALFKPQQRSNILVPSRRM